MKKIKLKHYIIPIIVFFSCFHFVSASIYINEVMLGPTEKRFIELYNSGENQIDLTGWYIQRKTATGTTFGSLVSKTYFEGLKIDGGDYLLISKLPISGSDIVVDNLTLTESNEIQLKNEGKEIVDSLSWNSVSEGKSFQRINNNDWVVSLPTPGFENEEKGETEEDFREEEDVFSVDDDKSKEKNTPRQITTKIISPRIVFAGLPFTLDSLVKTNKGETFKVGVFKWNFGDGTFKEIRISEKFEHTYFYPGDYVLVLDFSERASQEMDSSDRIIIRVVSNEIIINSVGDYKDPFVEIENKSNYEIVLSDWIITAGFRHFRIPQGTILMAKSKIKFSPKITGFFGEDLKNVIILDPKGQIVTTFPLIKNTSFKKNTNKVVVNKVDILEEESSEEKEDSIIDLNSLGASANKQSSRIPSNYAYFGLGGIILIGFLSILSVRQGKESINEIEGEIRAEDITIIE